MWWHAGGLSCGVLTPRLCQPQLRALYFLLLPLTQASTNNIISIIPSSSTASPFGVSYCGLSKFLSFPASHQPFLLSRHPYSVQKQRLCAAVLSECCSCIDAQHSCGTSPCWKQQIFVLHLRGCVHASMRNDLLPASIVRSSGSLSCSFWCLALSPCPPFHLSHDLYLHVRLLKRMRMTARALRRHPPLKAEDLLSLTFSLFFLLCHLASRQRILPSISFHHLFVMRSF